MIDQPLSMWGSAPGSAARQPQAPAGMPATTPPQTGVVNPLGVMQMANLGGGGGGAMGEGGTSTKTIAQVGGVGSTNQDPNAPQSATTTPTPTPTSAPAITFTPDDIAYIANKIDPEMAANLGFGLTGQARIGTDFFSRFNSAPAQIFTDPYPATWDADTFRNWFLYPGSNFQTMYGQVKGQPSPVSPEDSVKFLDYMSNVMELIQSGKIDPKTLQPTTSGGTTGQPGSTGTGSNQPGTGGTNFTDTERNAFRRPLTAQEQNWFNYVQAATTGQLPLNATQQGTIDSAKATLQARIDADLAAGKTPNIAAYTKEAADIQKQKQDLQTSNPGSFLYHAARGELPSSLQDVIQERVLQGMGNIGARYGTGTAAATGTALTNAAYQEALQAQQQVGQAQQVAALMEANREQAAQSAVYQEYLRNLGLSPDVQQLMNLLALNTGNTSNTKNPAASAGVDAGNIGSILSGVGAVAGAGSSGTNPFTSIYNWATQPNVNSQIPTVLPPNYYG